MPKTPTSPSKSPNWLWTHGAIDAISVTFIFAFLAGMGIWLWFSAGLPLWLNILLCLPAGFLHFYNYIVVNHEFMHTPPFKFRWMNVLTNVLSSLTLVYWMSMIDSEHALHHRYNNDLKRNGETKDPTSTYRKGKDGKQESVLTYIFLNFFRANTPVSISRASRTVWTDKKWRVQFILETIALLALAALVIWINPWFLLFMLVFSYIGWILTDMQNYYEHYRAGNPDSKFANSVSYYGKLYNFLMFNEGYHQEHHIKQNAHWTERPAVREQFREKMKENGHYVSSVPLACGFLDRSPPPPPRKAEDGDDDAY